MFFYGFKGFSNYRFTDREIETLLLRGYRKTQNARGAKAEGGDARFAALRREGAPNTAEESGQMRDSRVPHEEGFMEKYKFSGKGLYADYEFLYGRHPEYFEDANMSVRLWSLCLRNRKRREISETTWRLCVKTNRRGKCTGWRSTRKLSVNAVRSDRYTKLRKRSIKK